MDRDSVIEFLGHVPLLQSLPSSSLKRIAEVAEVKHYEPGEYVVREGQTGGGLYLIWEGQAEVAESFNGEEGNHSELYLGKHDYFGYGTGVCVHQVNVIALSKLTCLVLERGHSNLLQPRSIWNADEVPENFSPVERILHLEPLDKEESGFMHQEVLMPNVPSPEMLPSMEELRERRLTDPRLPMGYRNTVARRKFIPWPIEIRFVESDSSARLPSLNYWFKARGKLSDDLALHRCVVAYASDLIFSGVSLNPHKKKGLKTASLSLDHSIWFHRPIKADEWLLYTIDSPSAYGGRGFVCGRMFNQKGELVASLTQEALIRKSKQPDDQAPKAKL